MLKKMTIAVLALAVVVGVVPADEYDAIITDASRAFTKRKNSPEAFTFGKLKFDSQGKVISTVYTTGILTKTTKVAMGAFDAKKKKWSAGEAIEGGLAADIFNEKGKTLQVRIITGNDGKTITHILVKNTDEPLVQADREYDAILKAVGNQTNGLGSIFYTRVEMDENRKVTKKLVSKTGTVTKDTQVVTGKYNAATKKWEAGDPIPNGLFGEPFKNLNSKDVYVRITLQEDRPTIAQILLPHGKK